jgi:hypothetical protein
VGRHLRRGAHRDEGRDHCHLRGRVETTARPGEVIFLDAGTPVVYSAKEEGAELVYVTYPHWSEAVLTSELISKRFVEEFQPSDEPPEPSDAVALLRSIFDPLERGEADDFGRFTTRSRTTSCSRTRSERSAGKRR